jgi:hypothetical protein
MYVACVACHIKVLGYIEDLRSTYIFPEFLYLYQLTLHPSPNTPLISTIRIHSHELISDKAWQLSNYRSSNNYYGLGFCIFCTMHGIWVLGM